MREPTNPSSIPVHPVTFLASLGGLKTEWKNPEGLVRQQELWWFMTVWKGRLLPFPRSEASPHLWGSLLVTDKWDPNHHGKDTVRANPVVSSVLARAFAPDLFESGVSVHSYYCCVNGHHIQWLGWLNVWSQPPDGRPPTSPRGQEGPEQMGASGRVPSCSPSRSPERLPSLDPPGPRYCLGIHMTLTNEIGAEPPPPHTWMVPLVEDMLCHGRTSLTEVVVTGPGSAVLFYRRQSQGGPELRWSKRCIIHTYQSRYLDW